MAKHSYRQIKKRNFAKNVLFYIKDPQDAKSIFKFSPNMTERDKKDIQRAFEVGQHLIDETKRNNPVNLHQYTPVQNEIRKALHITPTIQTTLF